MRKLLICLVCMVGFYFSTFAQKDSSDTVYDNVFKGLEHYNVNYADFADSVKMFVIFQGELIYNTFDNKNIVVRDFNTIITYMQYKKYSLSKARSSKDKGFIGILYTEKRSYQLYMVLNRENKVSVILIK